MKRKAEIIDLTLLAKSPENVKDDDMVYRSALHFPLKEAKLEEYLEKKVQGIIFPMIHAAEQERLISLLQESGNFDLEIQEHLAEDSPQPWKDVSYIAIRAIYKNAENTEQALREVCVLSGNISQNFQVLIPGW